MAAPLQDYYLKYTIVSHYTRKTGIIEGDFLKVMCEVLWEIITES